ncbi:MAG: PTS sugar transporter subunit IIA, partial [Spirochaetales bacterium]
MGLIDLVTEEIVRVPLKAATKLDVLKELVQVLFDAKKIQETGKPLDAILAREKQGSTGLEDGIAVPHAKTEGVDTLRLAIGIAPAGIDFAALDGKPSQLFFLMLGPPGLPGPHIEALSEIARLTRS